MHTFACGTNDVNGVFVIPLTAMSSIVPAGGAGGLIGADPEPDLDVLVREGRAQVQGDGGEIRPPHHAIHEGRATGADGSDGADVGGPL